MDRIFECGGRRLWSRHRRGPSRAARSLPVVAVASSLFAKPRTCASSVLRDREGDSAEAGFTACADWLAWRLGVSRMTASEKIRAARALEALPLVSEAMGRGELSFSKVRALTRVATPENEAELLAYARASSAASLERLVRGWKTLEGAGEQRVEQLRHRRRAFSVFPDGEGMYLVRAA